MGGYLVPRAAAFDSRIDGVVAFDVLFDVEAALRSATHGSSVIAWLREHDLEAVSNTLLRLKMQVSPQVRWGVNNAMWVRGLHSPSEVVGAFKDYTLAPVAQKIRSDVLILAGSDDTFVPNEQVKQFESSLTHARSVKTVVYDEESGGKAHCQDGAITLWQATFFDWLSEKYPSPN